MPPRFTPFYQSLANQGMRQTNNNIGRINTPVNNFSNPYQRPNFQQGSPIGQLIDGEMGAPPNPWQPDYEPSTGGVIDVPNYLTPPLTPEVPGISPGTMLDKMGTMEGGFDVNNDGIVNELDIQAYQNLDFNPTGGYYGPDTGGEWMNQSGFEDYDDWGMDLAQQYGYSPSEIDNPSTFTFEEMMQDFVQNYNYQSGPNEYGYAGGIYDIFNQQQGGTAPFEPPSNITSQQDLAQWIDSLNPNELQMFQGFYQDMFEQDYLANPTQTDQSWQDYLGSISDFQSDDENQSGDFLQEQLSDMFESQLPYQTDIVPGEYVELGPSPGEQAGYGTNFEQGFIDNLQQYMNPQQTSAQQFTGGGGSAGGAARKLYYPGTSGGFAGVGSGIGGGSTLQDLLKGLG
jgi:hypothetical protein